jgi:NADPH2:quinone reductase
MIFNPTTTTAQKMKFIEVLSPGGPEVMHIAEGPPPVPAPGQVLIKVAAAGVNRADILQRTGAYPPPPGASAILGLEVAGEIVMVTRDCGILQAGDKVCALLSGGGYAGYVVADAASCLPIPAGLSLIEAASLPEAYFTVWSNVLDRAGLTAGETFLVHGGSSGIGSAAIQLARASGARVFATAGSDEKCRFCLALGADLAFNYRTRDFVTGCLEATGGCGVDVILDMVGGDYLNRNIQAAAEDGRIIMIAGIKGYKTEVDLLAVLRKRVLLTGSTLRSRPAEFKRIIAGKLLTQVWPMLESGVIKPVVYRAFPLDQAADAHRLMESSKHMGKIMLTVD